MSEINKEVKKGKSNFAKVPSGPKKTGIVTGVAKKPANRLAGLVPNKETGKDDSAAPKKSFMVMSGVAKKKDQTVDRRGELIEQNQDGLEYSSEEDKEETPEEAMAKLKAKGKKDLAMVDHNKIQYIDF